jgi:hypothetical protein
MQIANINGVFYRILSGCLTVTMRDFGKISVLAGDEFTSARDLDDANFAALISLRFVCANQRVLVGELN